MALVIPQVAAKVVKTGVPAPAVAPHPEISFAQKLKGLLAKNEGLKAAEGGPKLDKSAAEKLVAEKATAETAKTEKASRAKTPEPVVKPPVKPEPKEKKAPTDAETSLIALANQPVVAQPTVLAAGASAKAAAKDDAAAALAATEEKTKAKVPARSPNEKTLDKAANTELPKFEALLRSETKRAEKDAEKSKITVVDRRTDKDKAKKAEAELVATPQVPVTAEQSLTAIKANEGKPVAEVQAVFQSVSGSPREQFETPAKNTPVSAKDAVAFQQYLVEKGYGQLVEQARIILKNDNQGEIRMTLYPETLGKIKVALNLSDSHLAGQIFVENQTVKEILQDNMGQLLQSFREGGFGDMNIQVSVGDGSGQKSAGENASGFHAAGYDRQVSTAGSDLRPAERISAWSDRQVNLTA